MSYVFLRLKNDSKKLICIFIFAFIFSCLAFYIYQNYFSSYISRLIIIDEDNTILSKSLVENIAKNSSNKIYRKDDLRAAMTDLEIKKADFILVILGGFSKNISKDLYEDSIDIYYRESDTKTDIIKDIVSIETIKIWSDTYFKGLDIDVQEAKTREYISINTQNFDVYEKNKNLKFFISIFTGIFVLFWIILSRRFFRESVYGIKNRLLFFGIKKAYYVHFIVYRIIIFELISFAVYLANRVFLLDFLSLAQILSLKIFGYAYFIILEIVAFILAKVLKSESSFTFSLELAVLFSFIGVYIFV